MFRDFIYLEDDEVTIDGVRFYGSPWTPVFFDWAFMKKRGADIAEVWKKIPQGLDVLITHGPPQGILDDAASYRGGGGEPSHAGCADLRARVRFVKPKLHFFGHIHMQQGVFEEDGIRYVNCTTSECEQRSAGIHVSFARAFGPRRATNTKFA
jgi:Icc-related predicted phosphoesterase